MSRTPPEEAPGRARWILIPSLVFLAPVMGACGADQPCLADEAVTVAGYANPQVLVDTEWVLDRLDDPTVRLIDVSTRAEVYEVGHLPGAHFVQWNTDLTNPDNPVEGQILSRDALSELMSRLGVENHHTVVFYDEASNLWASRAYWVLKYYQHEDIRVYNGGSRKWVLDGQELTTGVDPVGPSSYTAGEPDPAIATDWAYVVSRLGDPSAMFCDTRSAAEHAGLDVRAERGGHIPGSVNVDWRESVQDDGTFLEAQELAGLYRSAGFTPDREIITYCQLGVRGAHTWFVLSELLGYPLVRNYDGSWAEYGNRSESPIQ